MCAKRMLVQRSLQWFFYLESWPLLSTYYVARAVYTFSCDSPTVSC